MGSQRILIASRPLAISAADFERYIRAHYRTVRHFDLLPEPRSVNKELIRATRSPYMNSRISEAQAAWFIERSASAPWSDVPRDASLVDADPAEVGGLYDVALGLYDHFRRHAPKGVGVAKLSKVLHLMRPALVPILDSRLTARYREAAADAARQAAQQRPDLGSMRRLYWAAVRDDLLASQQTLSSVRAELASSDDELVREASEHLSDLRLLDMVTWKQ